MDYEKTLETVKQMVEDGQVSQETAELYFPELAESEDEKIRKWLIAQLKIKIGDNATLNNMIYKAIAWLEKQGQQKPVDKVEPKFKVGDWIIQENIGVYKVIEVCESWYEVVDNKDKHYSIGFDKECMCRLWTIQDAKDGDVLHSPSHHLIWIYKDNEHYHSCVNMNYVTENVATDGLIVIPNDACPATKDEQTILFARMKEAGYEWDDENKKLEKIEQKPAKKPQRIVSAEVKEAMYDKPWSEDDENMLNLTLGLLSYHRQCRNWLKSLKERVQQPKQEWSTLDERNLQGIIDEIEANKNQAPDYDLATYDRFLSWLKSLRPQNRWKPSEEQIEALESATENCAYSEYQDCLRELIGQLKKLREE